MPTITARMSFRLFMLNLRPEINMKVKEKAAGYSL